MHQAQLAKSEVKGFLRRRMKLLAIAVVVVTGLSAAVAFYLPLQYKSSTTILVQRDETLNPMVRYNMAVAMASEDRLKSFNEILYSRATITMLIDSLNLDKNVSNRAEREALIDKVRSNIQTRLKASDSFSIIYYNTNPAQAKKGVQLLADHFINTKLKLENKRNKQTVDFFHKKLTDLREMVDERQRQLENRLKEDVKETPVDTRTLQAQMEQVDQDLQSIDRRILQYEQAIKVLRQVDQGKSNPDDLQKLSLTELPDGEQLKSTLNTYRQVRQKYTDQYPKVKNLEEEVFTQVNQVLEAVKSKRYQLNTQKSYLTSERSELASRIQKASVAERSTKGEQLDYQVYRKLLDEMKVKMEQAKTSRDLGKQAENSFVVLDPPIIPQQPTKPNRKLLLAGGFGLGGILGLLAAAIAELLDTTVRRTEDIKEFQKPVVAFIPEGN
ncbi:MAG: hypothetical protein K9N57_00135 [Candidatus Marinimicrobia bacterium]|nr:hypothetical protein [Candidatus Neomarinimicrobiota bacterium]